MDHSRLVIEACLALLGAIIGSFTGALVLRLPRQENWISGRSHCDGCGRHLSAWELIPLVSYFAVRGRCRSCGAPIAVDQPIAEAAGAIVGVMAGAIALSWIEAGALCLFGWLLIAVALLDARHFWLPDFLTLPLILLGLCAAILIPDGTLAGRVFGVVAGYVVLEAVRRGYRLLRGREGLGGGDAKLLAGIGAWMGISTLPWVLALAGCLGLALAALNARRGRTMTGSDRLPLGSFLAMAALALLPFCR